LTVFVHSSLVESHVPAGRGRPLQLAAAFAAAERRPASLEIVTLDDRLANAARKEGFALLDVTEVE
jgi:hypothetical protein